MFRTIASIFALALSISVQASSPGPDPMPSARGADRSEVKARESVPVEHRIVFSPTGRPEPICGSPIECGHVGIVLYSRCTARLGAIEPRPALYTVGRVHHYSGALRSLGRIPTADKSVRDHESIQAHVLAWHVEPALALILPEVEQFAAERFESETACRERSHDLSQYLVTRFNRALARSQELEDRRVDVAAELATGRFVASFESMSSAPTRFTAAPGTLVAALGTATNPTD